MKIFTLFVALLIPFILGAQNREPSVREQIDFSQRPRELLGNFHHHQGPAPSTLKMKLPEFPYHPEGPTPSTLKMKLPGEIPSDESFLPHFAVRAHTLKNGNAAVNAIAPVPDPSQAHVLKGGNTGDNADTPVLDSSYVYDISGNHYQIKRYYYNEHNYPVLGETFSKHRYIDEPWDLVIIREEWAWDEAGNMTSEKFSEWDRDDLIDDDYLVRYHNEYGYDQAGRQTFESGKRWNSETSMLENQQRWYREYDQNGNQIYHLRQTGRGQEWLNNSLSELEYFADGNLKSQKSKNADSDGNWDRGYFNHYDNYINGTVTTYLQQVWSASLQDWVNDIKGARELDENGLPDFENVSFWDVAEEEWWHAQIIYYTLNEESLVDYLLIVERDSPEDEFLNHFQSFYGYNGTERWSGNLQQNWDRVKGEWVNSKNYTREYNDRGERVFHLYEVWDPATESWKKNTRYHYDYDAEGRQTYFMFEGFNIQTGELANGQRWEQAYDDNGQLLLNLTEFWSAAFNVWYGAGYTAYEYNESGQLILSEFKGSQNPQTGDWQSGSRYTYKYDSKGHRSEETRYSWNVGDQEFTWHTTSELLNDHYGNVRRGRYSASWFSGYEETEGFVTYRIDLAILGGGEPLEGAGINISGEWYVSDEDGKISFTFTAGMEMEYDYILEKDNYSSMEGFLYIDRNISMTLILTPAGTATYMVTFTVLSGTGPIENARVSLSGYGEKKTGNEGTAVFSNVVPGSDIPFTVMYEDHVYESTVTVADEDVSTEVVLEVIRGELWPESLEVRLYPVPAHDFVILELGGLPGADVRIYDMRGRMVLGQFCSGERHTLGIGHLPAGTYIVRITAGNEIVVKRLLVK